MYIATYILKFRKEKCYEKTLIASFGYGIGA